jgi:zinc and cadmium transporter
MLLQYTYPIISVFIVSAVSLVGVLTLSLKEDALRRHVHLLISLAVGALLGDAFIHLIPEAFERAASTTTVSFAIIVGVIAFFIIEKVLHWHHHALGEHDHETIHPTGKMILISDGVHNFVDGLIIAASYFVSIEVGIATTIAIILHEIPQEIGDFGVLIHSGYSKAQALWFNFLSALMSIAGVVVAFAVSGASEILEAWLVPIAAGGFIYIALSDLIPELNKTKKLGDSFLQLAVVSVGILAMFALLWFE